MKKFTLVTVIIINCLAFMTGCSFFDSNNKSQLSKLTPLLALLQSTGGNGNTVDCTTDPGNPACDESITTVFAGPSIVAATDGDYTDIVGVDWSPVEGAVSYNVYRSTSEQGPFNLISTVEVANINAAASNMSKSITAMSTSTPPRVSIPTPANGATNVAIDTIVTADFNENVNCLTLTASSFTLTQGSTPMAGTVICSGSTGTFIPSANLASNTTYTATVTAAVQDPEGTPMTGNYSWSFTTASVIVPTPPGVTVTIPGNSQTDVAVTTTVKAVFNENINCSTVTSSSFTLNQGGTSVAGSVSCTGSTANFTPSADLANNTEYIATVTTGVKDQEGTPMTADYSWSFTTTEAPVPVASHYFIDTNAVQGSHYFYAIAAVNAESKESTRSIPDEGYALSTSVPGKVKVFIVMSGTYNDRIEMVWQAPEKATYYRVYRSDGTTSVQVSGDITGTSFIDTTIPPGLNAYKVYAFNTHGQGGCSDPVFGYRAVTDLEFFKEALKEELHAIGRLTSIGQLTTEVIYDMDGDGTCVYTAEIAGMESQGSITFSNFCDYYLQLDGSQQMTMDATLKGKITDYRLNVSGIYWGYIDFVGITIAITNNKLAITGGSYLVSQFDKPATTIPYTETPLLP